MAFPCPARRRMICMQRPLGWQMTLHNRPAAGLYRADGTAGCHVLAAGQTQLCARIAPEETGMEVLWRFLRHYNACVSRAPDNLRCHHAAGDSFAAPPPPYIEFHQLPSSVGKPPLQNAGPAFVGSFMYASVTATRQDFSPVFGVGDLTGYQQECCRSVSCSTRTIPVPACRLVQLTTFPRSFAGRIRRKYIDAWEYISANMLAAWKFRPDRLFGGNFHAANLPTRRWRSTTSRCMSGKHTWARFGIWF